MMKIFGKCKQCLTALHIFVCLGKVIWQNQSNKMKKMEKNGLCGPVLLLIPWIFIVTATCYYTFFASLFCVYRLNFFCWTCAFKIVSNVLRTCILFVQIWKEFTLHEGGIRAGFSALSAVAPSWSGTANSSRACSTCTFPSTAECRGLCFTCFDINSDDV